MSDFLADIDGPDDLKHLAVDQLPELADEIRGALIAFSHAHGGHIGSNLGLVEATIALHYVFDSPRDHIIFDVSHQSYVHKMLTGRREAFTDPTRFGEVTGFTNPLESDHDSFVLGHTGTSISLACGMAKARDLMGGDNNVIALIGDGSLSSAVAFEGLNEAGEFHGNLIIVLNDNEMSIAEDHGGMYDDLAELRASQGRAQRNLFRAMGLDYRYVERGNDVIALVRAFSEVKDIDHPIVVHIHTLKGKGLGVEEGSVESNHWHNPDSAAGAPLNARKTYGMMAMDALAARFDSEPGLLVISPATPGSNGITREWRAAAGSHYIDTGITEEHAVAFAAGVARAGGTPVLATSATFFQRAYDQIHQEFALNQAPGTLLIFGGGISGTDNTHSGAGDIMMFGNVPGLTCLAPTSGRELLDMLAWSTGPANRPVAIRMPGNDVLAAERAGGYPTFADAFEFGHGDDSDGTTANHVNHANASVPFTTDTYDDVYGERDITATTAIGNPWARYTVTRSGSRVAIIGLGDAYPMAEAAARELDAHGVTATVVDPHQFSTLDTVTLDQLAVSHTVVVTIEDGQLEGGWGAKIASYYGGHTRADAITNSGTEIPMRVLNFGARKEVTDRIPLSALRERYRMLPQRIAEAVLAVL